MCVNKRAGGFTSQDAEKAIELARHVSTSIHQQPTDIPLGERPPVPTESVTATVRLIGDSESIRDLRHTIQRVSQTELPVLIMGENGTGKEVVSRMIHSGSKRADRPFLAVNCAAISETLLESELFGHEKGSFTDAHRTRAGKFELAHGGTLFLDEIGDMSLTGQVKLLRVLEEKVITRVGGTETIEADVRVLAATNKDLAQLVRDRLFREDLFFRLNVVTLRVPPLRARQRDILLLARHFLEEFSRRVERPIPVLSAEAERRLLQHQWPGNVRELRNLMERIVFLSTEDTVDEQVLAAVLPDSPTQPVGSMELPLSEATRQFQIDYISHHIEAARGNMSEAARRLGLHRSNLYRKLSQLGMAEPQ
jgi:Nif-specific regulatory protein